MDAKELAFIAGAAAVGVVLAGLLMSSFGRGLPVVGTLLKTAHNGFDS